MGLDATARRRWFGALALLAALLMLLGGETLLKAYLHRPGLLPLIYWLVCLGFTGLAVLAALFDVRALQHRTRQEQRDLFDDTLRKIEQDAQNKPRPPEPPAQT